MSASRDKTARPRSGVRGRAGAGGVPSNRFLESVLAAFKAIRANKVRATLTALGIMIGVMNVVAMVALISGINESVLDLFRSMGTNTFTVTKMPAGNVNYEQYLAVHTPARLQL